MQLEQESVTHLARKPNRHLTPPAVFPESSRMPIQLTLRRLAGKAS